METIKKIIDLYKNDRKEMWAIILIVGGLFGYNTKNINLSDYVPSFYAESQQVEKFSSRLDENEKRLQSVETDIKEVKPQITEIITILKGK